MNEIEIIKEIADKNERALESLYNIYSRTVYSLSLRYSNRKEDAEEITSDVFFKIWKNAKDFRGNSKLSTWIYRIAVNTALDFKAKKKVEEISFDEQNILIDKENDDHIDNELIQNALMKIPEQQRIAIILTQIENIGYKETSKIMNKSVKAIESLVQRGKENLRTILLKSEK